MVDLPSNISYTKITGRFSLIVMDTTGDANDLPERIPANGRVFLTPNLPGGFVKDIATLDIFVPQPVEITLDSSGQIVDKHNNQWVTIVSSDDPDLQPTNWTYTAAFDFIGVKLNSFSFIAKSGETMDLSTILPVVASTGTALSVAEAAAAAAASSAAAAAASAAGGGAGGLTTEQIQDMLATFLVAGTGIQLTYSDTSNLLTITNTGGVGGGTDAEVVRDTIGSTLVAGAGISIAVSDVGDTITITNTASADPEVIRDTIGAALRTAAGTALTITVDDAGDTITFGLLAGALQSQMNLWYPFYATSATTWPTRTLPPGYTLPNVIWNSEAYPGMTTQPPGLDGDKWQRLNA
jgi:hypothetical protein